MIAAVFRGAAYGLTLAALVIAACSADASETLVVRPEALPFGIGQAELPDDEQLLEELTEAREFRLGANFDRNFDAIDQGEAIEHATFTQLAIDEKNPSIDFLFRIGDELFEYEFRVVNGLGNRLRGRPGIRAGAQDAPNMRRVHKAEFGGPDSYSCATCHSKGGPDGAGANTQNAYLRGNGNNAITADERSAPHVLGLGPIAALGNEMSALLQAQRDAAIARAVAEQAPQEQVLTALGVSFGSLSVSANGRVDTSNLSGVDPDLVVKPFGWKGHHASLRGMAEESFRIHMGLVSMREQAAVRDGQLDRTDYGDGTWFDVDRDGVATEVEAGMLTTIVCYLSQLQVPVVRPPRSKELFAKFTRGEELFEEVGCGQCHRQTLLLSQPIVHVKPAEARYADRPGITVNVALDGDHPKIEAVDAAGSAYQVRLFSDLRRHDMGERLTSGYQQGHLAKSLFLTRPLWGLADTGPYLHDGRAPTVHDAIVWHGGEAQAVVDAYLALEREEQSSLLVFLLSLGREPRLFVP